MPTPLIKKLSLKNIALHLRGILPSWAYEFLLHVRLMTFPRLCKKDASFPNYTDGEWVTRGVTKDQRAIELYLQSQTINGAHILHIGMGNSHIAQIFASSCTQIDGITIVPQEIDHANALKIKNYRLFLMNKYSNDLPSLPGNYTYIIDNNLASYACCKTHFFQMLRTYLNLLAPNGCILTGTQGIKYFDSGFGMTDGFISRLKDQLQLSWTPVAPDVIAINSQNIHTHDSKITF